MSDLVRTACCDLHSTTCEPPSELCCDQCTEAGHGIPWWYDHTQPTHADGTPCVLADLDQRGYARGFAQGIAYAKAHQRPVPAADDPGVVREAPGPERGRERL